MIGYILDGPGIEFLWGRDFSHPSRPGLGPNQLLIKREPGVFAGVELQDITLTTHPHITPRLKKEESYTSATLRAYVACSTVKFTSTFYFITYDICMTRQLSPIPLHPLQSLPISEILEVPSRALYIVSYNKTCFHPVTFVNRTRCT